MSHPCEESADRIVEYVDGELPPDEAQAVARHLAECEDCRRMAGALSRSLGLATVLWSENLGDRESATQSTAAHEVRPMRFYAVAASLVITGSVLLLSIHNHHPQPPSIRFEDVERQVARAGMAAQLLAATRIVAQCEGMESVVEQQYRYILREYADTPAAESIRARQGSYSGGIP
jgi:anti-sigma factor RsiW